jgi:SAM-dependent methyltransferase
MPHTDDYCPLDDDTSAMQIEALLDHCADLDGWIIDLGCGDGRTAVPLAAAGARVLAIDHDPAALDALRSNASSQPLRGELITLELKLGELTPERIAAHTAGPIGAALCLGHTFMLLDEPLEALRLLRTLRACMADGAFLAIDDFPVDLWYEVSEGNWQAGIAEMEAQDGSGSELWQMVWKPGEPVIALRRGEEVDPDEIEILPTDRLHRIYSMGELRLLAACAGFAPPERLPESGLIVFTTAPDPDSDR